MGNREQQLKEKMKELGYKHSIYSNNCYKKHFNDYCCLHINLETNPEYKKERLIQASFVESTFIIFEQRAIDEIQKGYNQLQEDLKQLEGYNAN